MSISWSMGTNASLELFLHLERQRCAAIEGPLEGQASGDMQRDERLEEAANAGRQISHRKNEECVEWCFGATNDWQERYLYGLMDLRSNGG